MGAIKKPMNVSARSTEAFQISGVFRCKERERAEGMNPGLKRAIESLILSYLKTHRGI